MDKEQLIKKEELLKQALGTPASVYRHDMLAREYRNPLPLPELRNPAEDAAKWNAIMMRRMVEQQGENLVAVISERVKCLEATLQTDESLVVYCDAGKERIRVESFEFPNWHLAVVSGLDEDGNKTYRIENVQDIKLTCKVVKSTVKTTTIGFVLPAEK
jgi:hypothetical protein